MADKFYSFIGNERAYVGELTGSNSNKSALEYHLKRCLPGLQKDFKENVEGHDVALERALCSFLIKNGGKECLSLTSDFIENDADSVIISLKASLDKYVLGHFNDKNCPYNKKTYQQGDFYNDIMKYYGQNSKEANIRVPEMLLILLKSKEMPMWNTHANYGPRRNYIGSIENYINVKVLQNREEDARRLKPYIMFTFDIEGLSNEINTVINSLIGRKKQSINRKTGHKQVAIDVLKNPDFVKIHNKVVSKSTIERAQAQLQDFVDKALPQNADGQTRQVRDDMLKLIDELKQYKGKRYTTLIKAINDTTKKYEEINFTPTDYKTFDDFTKFLIKGLNDSSFSSFMGGKSSELQKLYIWYRTEFTNYIQSTCFPSVTDLEYHKGKRNIRDNIGLTRFDALYMQPGAFYPTYLREKEKSFDGKSLCLRSLEKMKEQENNTFIITNGTDHIYPEQIAFFLNRTPGAEPFNYNNTDSTFISILADPEQIQGY